MQYILLIISTVFFVSCDSHLENGIYLNKNGIKIGVKNDSMHFYYTGHRKTFAINDNETICCFELIEAGCFINASADTAIFEIDINSNLEFLLNIKDTCIKRTGFVENKFVKIEIPNIPWDSLSVSFLPFLNADTTFIKNGNEYVSYANSILTLDEEINYILNGNLDEFHSSHGPLQPFMLKIFSRGSMIYNKGIKNLPIQLYNCEKLFYSKLGQGKIYTY